MFTREKVYELVVRAIVDIQEMSGRITTLITEDTRPMDELEGFDSLNATEVCCLLSDLVGLDIDLGIFEREDGQHATVRQIVERLCTILDAK